MLPTPLLDYLLASPLPTLVLSLPSPSSPTASTQEILSAPPLISNLALEQLTRGRGLLNSLDEAGLKGLVEWLEDTGGGSSGISTASSGETGEDHDADLNLELHLPTAPLSSPSASGAPSPALSTNSSTSSLALSHTPSSQSQTTSATPSSSRKMSVRFRKSTHAEADHYFLVLTALSFPPKRLSGKTLRVPQKILSAPGGAGGTVREERSTEERLAEMEMLFDCSAVGLARLTLEGRVMWVNQSWWGVTRLDPQTNKADEWVKIIESSDYDDFMILWAQARQELTPWSWQFRLKTGVVVLAQCAPNFPDPSLVTGWIMNLTDVTERVRAAEALQQIELERAAAAQALEAAEGRRLDAEAQRTQQELVLDVTSHELRNPISAIYQNSQLTQSSLLRRKNLFCSLPPDAWGPSFDMEKLVAEIDDDIAAVTSIGDCAMAMGRVANDILGMAHVASQRYSIERTPFRLASSLRTTLRMFSSDCAAKDIQLDLLFGPLASQLGEEVDVLADSIRFSQILINLITNAIRFTAPRPTRRITVSVELSSDPPNPLAPCVPSLNPNDVLRKVPEEMFLYFAVEDTGPGMSDEDTARVFAALSRDTPLTHVKIGGAGIGLWISRNLCELHGGRLELASRLGVGSVFRGFITVGLAPAIGTPRTTPLLSPSSPRSATQPRALNRPLRILVVDDNQINRTIFVRQLSLAGHLVECAVDGKEALDKLLGDDAVRYDCCLMDIEMPIIDGVTATRTLREAEAASGNGRHLRVVGCTGNARDGQINLALAGGLDACITKPYRLASLLEALAG